ncbi:MAG: S49 family peptidase [Anaerolineaceae bacterium]|nr:S49 family peptidase [Anaerolineaceae bacterium]
MKTVTLTRAAMETPWAILPANFAVIVEVVTRHFAGEKLDAEEVQNRIHGAKRPAERTFGNVAILPLFGTIFPRANLMTEVCGATSSERFGAVFSDLVKNPDVSAIVLDVDSPGGQVPGVDELSTKIFDARGTKPIVAIANHMMASAAYWIGTAADELIVTPSAEVGSIGVFTIHEDLSESLTQQGIKISLISEGKYKTEGNPYQPLSEENLAAMQSRVAEYYDSFVKTIARNRGVKQVEVREGFGEGRLVGARQAVSLGMADRIATLEETVSRLQRGTVRRSANADTDFRKRRMRLTENSGSFETGNCAP